MELIIPSKDKFFDSMGKPMTQSLFLELGYNDNAVYTLKESHYEYKGHLYPSLRKLFIEEEDPTEYQFAIKYLIGWNHWKRMCDNRVLSRHIVEWREELELRLRSKGVKQIMQDADKGGFNSAKWLAEKGWDKKLAGRPSKEEIAKETAIQASLKEEYGADVHRLSVAK